MKENGVELPRSERRGAAVDGVVPGSSAQLPRFLDRR
jgi:hypothetical protein